MVLTNLAKYCDLLQEYNQKFNLTAIVSTEDIYLKHFLDSIITTKYFRLDTFPDLVDVGTGAGFPGLILKIFNPGLKTVHTVHATTIIARLKGIKHFLHKQFIDMNIVYC